MELSRRLAVVASQAAIAILLSCCAADDAVSTVTTDESPSVNEATFDISGRVEVKAIANGRPGEPCRPDEESVEWPARPGAQKSGVQIGGDVTVTNASGDVVGLGEVHIGEYMESGYDVSSYCTVPFQVGGVRDGDQVYGVSIGDLPMKRYLREELDQPITIVVPGN